MRTKEAMIKELKNFISDLKNDCMPDMSDTRGLVVIVYDPSILGSDDDMWHHVVNTYDNATSAMDRYANTMCTESCVVTWSEHDGWMETPHRIDIAINTMINRLSAEHHN